MATLINNAPRVISLNGGEHNGRAPGGLTMLPNSAPVKTSDDLDEVLRADRSFLALVAKNEIVDVDRTFGVTVDLVRSPVKAAPVAQPTLPDPPASTLSTAQAVVPPAPVVAPSQDEASGAESADPFADAQQPASTVSPAELAALPADQALAHVASVSDLAALKAFWMADTRPEMRAAIEARAREVKAAK